jgi:hypothetical protein
MMFMLWLPPMLLFQLTSLYAFCQQSVDLLSLRWNVRLLLTGSRFYS